MTYGETVGNQFGIDGAKILVWGAVGDKLKVLDKNRMLALIQDDPDFYLAVIANMEADTLIEMLLKIQSDDEDLNVLKDIEEYVYKINKLDAVFSEATEFLHDSGDMLATGSFITGEFEQKYAILKTMGRVPDDVRKDNNNVDRLKINVVPLTS
jgi:hypothetical protein